MSLSSWLEYWNSLVPLSITLWASSISENLAKWTEASQNKSLPALSEVWSVLVFRFAVYWVNKSMIIQNQNLIRADIDKWWHIGTGDEYAQVQVSSGDRGHDWILARHFFRPWRDFDSWSRYLFIKPNLTIFCYFFENGSRFNNVHNLRVDQSINLDWDVIELNSSGIFWNGTRRQCPMSVYAYLVGLVTPL